MAKENTPTESIFETFARRSIARYERFLRSRARMVIGEDLKGRKRKPRPWMANAKIPEHIGVNYIIARTMMSNMEQS